VSPQEKRRILVEYLKMKTEDYDWHAVSDAANDLREVEIELKLNPPVVNLSETSHKPIESKLEPIGDALPKDVEIPHQVSEVSKLLKLGDEDLVDRLFPDYTDAED
jgi:hypothetical protein